MKLPTEGEGEGQRTLPVPARSVGEASPQERRWGCLCAHSALCWSSGETSAGTATRGRCVLGGSAPGAIQRGEGPVTAPKQNAPGYRHFTDLPCHLQTSISHRNRGASPFFAACKLHTNVLEQKVSTDFHLPLQPRNYTKPMHYASHLFVPSQCLNPV